MGMMASARAAVGDESSPTRASLLAEGEACSLHWARQFILINGTRHRGWYESSPCALRSDTPRSMGRPRRTLRHELASGCPTSSRTVQGRDRIGGTGNPVLAFQLDQ